MQSTENFENQNFHSRRVYNLDRWQGNREKIFICGSSSGATLATVVSMMLRERNGQKLSGQILLCPLTDTSFNTRSYHENGVGYNLTRDDCMWFFDQYVPSERDRNNPLVAPIKASHFKNLPPALIVTAEFDPLRDEGREYAKKFEEAGVPCHDLYYKGMVHGFPTLPLELPEKKDVLSQIQTFIHAH